MKIVLLVKQVPETGSVRLDEATGTVIRKAADAVVNPLDLYAVEAALRLKEACGAETLALSMGPASAESALREVLAMGIDDARLVSDKAFAGSDTWATSRILAAAIRKAAPAFDLILCGERATDGDTGQVGPETAAALGIPVVTYVSRIGDCRGGALALDRLIEGATEIVSVRLPALVTVVKAVATPRLPTLDGKIRARDAVLPTLARHDLGLPADQVGLRGSPTRVVRTFRPQISRACQRHRAADPALAVAAAGELHRFLAGKGLL